jgi:RecB family endonuclease NucS
MKHLPFFLLLGLIALSSFTHPNPKVKTYELQKALDEGLVELLSIEYLGDKQLKIRVKNLHKRKDFKVHFKTGLQFASQDTSLQDQIIVRGRSVLVKAGKSV